MELGGINLLGKPKVFLVSTTHGAESHGLAAMMSTINILEMGKGLEENFNFGLLLKEGLENIISKHDLTDTFSILGDLNVVSTIDVKDSKDYDSNFLKTYMYQEVIKRGVLYNGLFYVMLAHREKEIQYTIDVFDEVLEDISLHLKNKSDLQLIGETIKPVFRKRI
jgi:glutamate-1-semialdehyde 2,1-aminomutase